MINFECVQAVSYEEVLKACHTWASRGEWGTSPMELVSVPMSHDRGVVLDYNTDPYYDNSMYHSTFRARYYKSGRQVHGVSLTYCRLALNSGVAKVEGSELVQLILRVLGVEPYDKT